jgi:hypothetical protein
LEKSSGIRATSSQNEWFTVQQIAHTLIDQNGPDFNKKIPTRCCLKPPQSLCQKAAARNTLK